MENLVVDQDSFLPKIDLENPRQISMDEIKGFYVAICAGKWVPAAKGQPDWAFNALNEFCRCCRTGLRKKPFGYLGSVPHLPLTTKSHIEFDSEEAPDGDIEFDEPIFDEFRGPRNLEELGLFLAGGKLIPMDLPVPDGDDLYISHTAQAYLIIFIAWQKIAALKTVPAIHNWLARMKAADKVKKINKDGKEFRRTRFLLKRIGFPLTDKGGRPSKKTLQLPHKPGSHG